MKRRTFLKSFIGVCISPGLEKFATPIRVIKKVPEAIYTAKTICYDARMALGIWFSEQLDRDIINALNEAKDTKTTVLANIMFAAQKQQSPMRMC